MARSPRFDWLTGSSDGLTGFSRTFYDLSPFSTTGRYFFNLFTGNQFFLVLVGWAILALGTLVCWSLVRSPWGRVLKAIREDEDAARSLGKNAYSYKMQALILGGMFGAVGGMVRAVGFSVAQPDNFITDVTFFVWVALILGGAGRVFGPLVGAALLYATLDFVGHDPASARRERLHPEFDHVRYPGRPGALHDRRTRPDPARSIPAARHLRQQGRDGPR